MPASSKEFLDVQATIEMTRTYSEMHRKYKNSEHSSMIWPGLPNGWVVGYELNDSKFDCSCSYLNFRIRACFEQGVPWHSGKCKVWIHSQTRTWNDKNIQSNVPYREVLTTHLNHLEILGKWLSVHLGTKWYWVWVQLQ